jgi:hypothetical protein
MNADGISAVTSRLGFLFVEIAVVGIDLHEEPVPLDDQWCLRLTCDLSRATRVATLSARPACQHWAAWIPDCYSSNRSFFQQQGLLAAVVEPLPKIHPTARASISASIIRPARKAAGSGSNGEKPAAIRSAFTKTGSPASAGRNSRAKVVLPAPFGPAKMITFFSPVTGRPLRSRTACFSRIQLVASDGKGGRGGWS